MISTILGCGQDKPVPPPPVVDPCAPRQFTGNSGNTGNAQVFLPDPISASGNVNLSPTSVQLDSFRAAVTLAHLGGAGILKGTYVEVMNGLECKGGSYNAFDPANQFSYSHSDPRFQEAMAYYVGDTFRSSIDATYLDLTHPVTVLAHCEKDDNAYFVRGTTKSGKPIEIVCLGDSVSTPGAYYGDDAIVTVHELQHATTVNNYSPTEDLNQFWYDEAGALNEAVSDFMGLAFTDKFLSPSLDLDPRVFSRWALGTFDPSGSHLRGAHKCPAYDSSFPECGRFPAFEVPTASNGNLSSISYVYPDGMGWPYANNYRSATPASQAYRSYPSQEEIHNAGMVLTGALWDVYAVVKKNHPDNLELVNKMMSQLVFESIRNLPMPNSSENRSPITFIGFAANLVTYMGKIPDFTANDQVSIQKALKDRGLYQMPKIASKDWLEVGSGTNFRIPKTETPGVFILDDPRLLQNWVNRMYENQGTSPPIIPQGISTGLNFRLDPGEVDAIWFDLQNNSDLTAGGVLLSITSTDPDVVVVNGKLNVGFMPMVQPNQAQIMYEKVNGNLIVAALNPASTSSAVSIGNSYFKTNPFFNKTYRTAIWVLVKPEAVHGKVVNFEIKALPANGNGEASTQNFPVTIN